MSKIVLFQAIRLSICSVLFQTDQFSIGAQFSSILPIDMTLSGATTPGQSGPGRDSNDGYSAFSKAPALLEPHHQIV